jgi:DNA-binding beta-propeller fold protein YncE
MESWKAKRVQVPATHAVFDPIRHVLLATVDATHPSLGNDLVEIDPESGAFGRHVFVGSRPARVAISDDASTAYVGLRGASHLVQVDLVTFTVVDTIELEDEPLDGRESVADLAVQPGHPDVLVAAVGGGVWAFQDGEVLPDRLEWIAMRGLEFVGDNLYGYDSNDNFVRMTVDATGVHLAARDAFIPEYVFVERAGDDYLIDTKGRLIDPAGPSFVRTFDEPGEDHPPFFQAVEAAPADDRVSFVRFSCVAQFVFSTGEFLGWRCFDELWTGTLPDDDPLDMVATDTGYVVLQPKSFTLLGPSVTPEQPQPPIAARLTVDTFVERVVPVAARDLVFDPRRKLLYASVGDSASTYRNSVVAFDEFTGAVTRAVFVGSNPSHLALSADGTALYVALESGNAVARINPTTFTEQSRFATGSMQDTPVAPGDIEVRPGHPNTVAVVHHAPAWSSAPIGVALYVDGVRMPGTVDQLPTVSALEFADEATLYGWNNYTTGADFSTMEVGATGVDLVSSSQTLFAYFGSPDIELAENGLLWSTLGEVIDPVRQTNVAQLPLGSYALEPVARANRIYQVSGGADSYQPHTLNEYDPATYRLLGRRNLANPIGGSPMVETTLGLAAIGLNNVVLLNPPACLGLRPTITAVDGIAVGTPGKDVIVGSSGSDVIQGLGGNDVICGLGGADWILGGEGNDSVVGGPGRQLLRGDSGDDALYGLDGADLIDGGSGNDLLYGGPGTDVLYGAAGTDRCFIRVGNDSNTYCETFG